jgi:4-hydroxybutyrate dehydrogenase
MSLISYLTRVHFADRVLEDALAAEMARNAIRRPLILSDPDTLSAMERLWDALPPGTGATELRIDPTEPAPTQRDRAIALLGAEDCDGVIGLGGARAIDLARAMARPALPVLTIPTSTDTIGLGSLARDFSIMRSKRPALPAAILCDPTLTTGADAVQTAASGMSVIVHCLESFLSTTFNPPADGMALEGLRRAVAALELAVADGGDLKARRELLAAALNAGLAAEKGFGGIEAAAHGLEAATQCRRGLLQGALLGEVLAFNAPAVHSRFAIVRTTLGIAANADLGDHLVALARRVGLPLRLSDAGITSPCLAEAAQCAAADPANRTNPRHATAADYESMMRSAL